MPAHAVELVRTSRATPAVVYELLADVPGWSSWAGPLGAVLEREGAPGRFGPGAVRRVGVGPAQAREEIIEAVPGVLQRYRVLSGFPVRFHSAQVHFEAVPQGCRVTWHVDFVPRVPGTGRALAVVVQASVGFLLAALVRAADRTV